VWFSVTKYLEYNFYLNYPVGSFLVLEHSGGAASESLVYDLPGWTRNRSWSQHGCLGSGTTSSFSDGIAKMRDELNLVHTKMDPSTIYFAMFVL
jgi:hypothetical protein